MYSHTNRYHLDLQFWLDHLAGSTARALPGAAIASLPAQDVILLILPAADKQAA